MKKVVLIPDSFKGTLSSAKVCEIMRKCIHNKFPDCEIVQIPVADGGEGTVDCFLQAVGGTETQRDGLRPLYGTDGKLLRDSGYRR